MWASIHTHRLYVTLQKAEALKLTAHSTVLGSEIICCRVAILVFPVWTLPWSASPGRLSHSSKNCQPHLLLQGRRLPTFNSSLQFTLSHLRQFESYVMMEEAHRYLWHLLQYLIFAETSPGVSDDHVVLASTVDAPGAVVLLRGSISRHAVCAYIFIFANLCVAE